ncbi:MAG: serine hydrolase domain-containing protein [Planctomycetaceae bacterium]
MPEFSQLQAAIQAGIDRRLHTCVQIYVSVDGQPVLDAGFGRATSDRPADSSTMMPWRSAGKPVTAAAICRLWQQGDLALESPIVDLLPKVSRHAVAGSVTVRQLLTHTSGLPIIDTGWPHKTWDETLRGILNITSLVPGNAYQPQSTWFLLGEIIRNKAGTGWSFSDVLKRDVLIPLGMHATSCGFESDSSNPDHADLLPDIFDREAAQLVPSSHAAEPWLSQPSPGGNLRGPIRELGQFYEMLMRDGTASNGTVWLLPKTVAAMTTRHRTGMYDDTFRHVVDFGLGLIMNSSRYGVDTVPYGFGRFSSPESFGHGGSQCSMAFCDPEHRLVVAWAANGFCGEGRHQQRNRAINEAIYHDLGFS